MSLTKWKVELLRKDNVWYTYFNDKKRNTCVPFSNTYGNHTKQLC